MSELFFSSTTKQQYQRGVLCECGHIRGQHRLLATYVSEEDEEAESNEDHPQILCHCKCVTFVLMDNLKYLEIMEKEKSEKINQ